MIAHKIDLLTDQEIVTANAVPKVIPPRTDSLTFPELAIISSLIKRLDIVCDKSIYDYLAISCLVAALSAGSHISLC